MRRNHFLNSHKITLKIKVCFTSALLVLLCQLLPELSFGQTQLDRISVAERNDGQGFVVRFHLTEKVDSFAIAHVEQQRMQLAVYNDDIIVSQSLIMPDSDVVRDVKVIQAEGNLIFELSLYKDQYFIGNSYYDVNQKDILLGLTYTDERLNKADSPFLDLKDSTEGSADEIVPSDSAKDKEAVNSNTESELKDHERTEEESSVANKNRSIKRVSPGDPMEFYLRWIGEEPGGSRKNNHLRYSGSSGSTEYSVMEYDHPWSSHPFFTDKEEDYKTDITLFNPVLFTSYNSDYPVGGNDGALWQGRGMNSTFSMGAGFENEFLEVVLHPLFVYNRNRDFMLSRTPVYEGLSKYAMALTYADIPQRFGEESIYRFDFGESFLKLKYKGWAAGLSNQRIRTGPAIKNPLLFGYNAPGFFHTFLGTDKPHDLLKGKVDFQLFWGNLRGSDYLYPEQRENNRPDTRFITGLSINYNPDYLPGLHLGFTRTAVSYLPDSGIEFGDLFMALRRSQIMDDDIETFDARLSKMALFIRWHFPKSGFEAYAEWGRYDNRRLLRDILLEPELNRAYVLGFIKRFNVGTDRRIVLNGEITNLENLSVTSQSRDFNIWYTHPIIKHGFTHRGQVLGAPIGPGSSTQQITTSYYHRLGMMGISLGRVAHHNDRFFKNLDFYRAVRARPWIPIRTFQEIEMFGAIKTLFYLPKSFELQADVRYGMIENRNNQFDLDRSEGELLRIFFDEPNWNVAFTLRYLLSSRNR